MERIELPRLLHGKTSQEGEMNHILRPYQIIGKHQIREHYQRGVRKVLLHLATGGGKTTVFSDILKDTSLKGNKGAMVVRGRKLVDQAHKRLLREGVPHGVIMNGHWAKNSAAPIQICSIDTVRSRGINLESMILVIDEAQDFVSQDCVDFCEDFMVRNPNSFILAVTATPYVKQSLRHLADVVVKPVTVDELMNEWYLVRPQYYCPTPLDVSQVKRSKATDDYVTADLEKILNASGIVGDSVDSWKKFAQDKKTLTFAVSIVHSKYIAEMYNKSGIKWKHMDADTPENEREDIIGELREGKISGISNVNILSVGFDLPELQCVQMCRPTESFNTYVQQAGRGTRPLYKAGMPTDTIMQRRAATIAGGKENFILLDNAGNVLRHGFITEEKDVDLDGKKPKNGTSVLIKTCKTCFAVFRQFDSHCPQCGAVNEGKSEKEMMVGVIDGKLVKIDEMPLEARAYQRFHELKKIRKEEGYKSGWVYYSLKSEFGDEIATKYCPKRELPSWLKR